MTARDKKNTQRDIQIQTDEQTQTQTGRQMETKAQRKSSALIHGSAGDQSHCPPSAPSPPIPTPSRTTLQKPLLRLCAPPRPPSRGPLSGRRRELGNRSEPFLALVWRQREANKSRNVKNTNRKEDRITLLSGRYW